jgi:integrase
VQEQMIAFNPCSNTHKPKDDTIRTKKMFLTDKNILILNKEFRKNIYLFIFQLALSTGMRQGEILALKHSDINDVIHVTKSVNIVKVISKDSHERKTIIRPCKNKASVRDLPISKTLLPNLELHIKMEKEKHLKKGVPFSTDNLFYTNQNCSLVRATHLLARWKRIEKRGIEPVSFHGLRHTFCSLLAKNNVSLKTASVLMGHSNIEITAKIYTHIQDSQKSDAIDKLDHVLSTV